MEIKPVQRIDPPKFPKRELQAYKHKNSETGSFGWESIVFTPESVERANIQAHLNDKDTSREDRIRGLKREINQGRYELSEKIMDIVVERIMIYGLY